MSAHDALAATLRARLAELGGHVAALEAERRGALSDDFADQAGELETQDALAGIEDAHLAEARAIQIALTRIAAGSYGRCSRCGADIDPARLAALPTATTCIACAA